jgi:hypothetical protein
MGSCISIHYMHIHRNCIFSGNTSKRAGYGSFPCMYYTGNHFVSRIISPTGEVWYHDGIETKRQCIHEGHLIDFSENSLKFHGSKRCVGIVYSV